MKRGKEMVSPERFFGRADEIREIESALLSSAARIVTITGIGGMGKTSLALRVMHELETSFPGGCYFIPLSELEHSAQLVPAILSSMGALHRVNDPNKSLSEIISTRKVLLVLDNFEHIIAASTVVKGLARSLSDSRFLITSRTRLNLPYESVYKLEGFPPPAGVKLFMASSGKEGKFTDDEMPSISEICCRIAGVPLGIKLAASLCSRFTPDEILLLIEKGDNILDVTSISGERRHRNLRSVFNYSWKFMNKEERRVFSSLSVFKGPFTPEAANEVTGTSPDTFRSLVEKSLVEKTPDGYYSLHPLLKEFSANKFQDSPDRVEVVRDKHARYFCNCLEKQSPGLNSAESADAMNALNACYPDIIEGLDRAISRGMMDVLTGALGTLRIYLVRRGLLEQGRRIFENAIELMRANSFVDYRETLTDLAFILTELTRYDLSVPLLEEAMESEDPHVLAKACYSAGVVYMRTGNLKRAEKYMNLAVEHARNSAELPLIAIALGGLGDVYNHYHDWKKAEYFIIQALEIDEKTGNNTGLLSGYITLSNLMFNHEQGPEALEYANKALKLSATAKGDRYYGLAEVSAAGAHELLGNLQLAREHAEKSVECFERINWRWGMQAGYSVLASVQSKLKMKDALSSVAKLEDLCNELGGTYNTMEHLITAGEVYERIGMNRKALEAYQRAEKIANNLNLNVYLEKISKAIRKFVK